MRPLESGLSQEFRATNWKGTRPEGPTMWSFFKKKINIKKSPIIIKAENSQYYRSIKRMRTLL